MTYNENDFLADLWEGITEENIIEWDAMTEEDWNSMAEDAALEGSLFGWEA